MDKRACMAPSRAPLLILLLSGLVMSVHAQKLTMTPPEPPNPPSPPPDPPYDYPPESPPDSSDSPPPSDYPPDFPPVASQPDWKIDTSCQAAPSGYTFQPQMDNLDAYAYSCGAVASSTTFNGFVMNSTASLAAACNANTSCASFVIFLIAPEYYNKLASPERYCLKVSSQHLTNYTLFMPTACYGIFIRNGAASRELPPAPPPRPPTPPRPSPVKGHAVASVKAGTGSVQTSSPILSVPTAIKVPSRSHTLPADYVFPPIPNTLPVGSQGAALAGALGPQVAGRKKRNSRRGLTQSEFGNDPLRFGGGALYTQTTNIYVIYVGLNSTDPQVIWTNYFLQNVGSSSYFRTLQKYSNKTGGFMNGQVILAANVFLDVTGSASLDSTGSSTTDVKSVVDYCMRNNLVIPNDSLGIYIVVTSNDPALTLPRDYLLNGAMGAGGYCGWHFISTGSSGEVQYTYSFMPLPPPVYWTTSCAGITANAPELSPSGDAPLDGFLSVLAH